MADLWVPGSAQPSLDDFVGRLHTHIERFARERADGQAAVEVELRDGSVLRLASVIAEPGYGFVTLCPHGEEEEPEELIVPVGAIGRIKLMRVTEQPPFGFGPPSG